MPPEPLLKKLPQLQRTLLYFPTGLLLGLVLFFLVGLTNALGYVLSLLTGLALGFGAATLLLGPPRATLPRRLQPLAAPKVRPWYFFPIALVVGAVAYALAGIAYTNTPLPVEYSVHAALATGLLAGCGVAYWRVGFPSPRQALLDAWRSVPEARRPWLFFPLALLIGGPAYLAAGLLATRAPLISEHSAVAALPIALLVGCLIAYKLAGFPTPNVSAREAWRRVPPERRPWLFLPLGLTLSLALTFLLGLGLTALPFLPVDYTAYTATPLALLVGFGAAYKLVGVPKPKRHPRELLPDVPGAARPVLFALTLLAAGPLYALITGPLIGAIPLLPPDFILAAALLTGYLAAFATAAALWGIPGRWKGAQVPKLPDDARLALLLPTWLVSAFALTFLADFLAQDLFISGAVGVSLGLLTALKVSGATRKLARRRGDTLLPELPDKVKPLVLFPTWVAAGTILFVLLGYAGIPFHWSLTLGASLGLATAVAVVEEPLIRQAIAEWREKRARKARLEERREAEMARVKRGK